MPDTVVTIHVVRSGGFAGLTREWSVEGDRDEWMPLVDACPWRDVPRDPASRDRYVWRIEVEAPRKRRRAEVPDAALTGPWRELVERVRAA
jgi:hypothetical protein